MIDLLYHAIIYYEIRKFVQESEPAALMYELVIEKAKAHEQVYKALNSQVCVLIQGKKLDAIKYVQYVTLV